MNECSARIWFSKVVWIIVGLSVVLSVPGHAQEVVDGFSARTMNGSQGRVIPYRLFIPSGQPADKLLPLIVYLHGANASGSDNLQQLGDGNTAGTHLWTTAAMQSKHPAFVLAPQVPVGAQWGAAETDSLAPYAEDVLALIGRLPREFTIDPDRVYLVGQSLGGYGVWDIIAKRPEMFAAALPLCGAGDPTRIVDAKNVAIWAFHGAKDQTVPVTGSREMVAALKAVGSPVKYTEYPNVGHDVWTVAFAEKALPDWLFTRKRPQR